VNMRPPRDLRRTSATGRCPWGSAGAAGRWCSRWLHVARKGATKAKSAATASMKGLIVTAPQQVRELFPLRATPIQVVNIAARFRPASTRLDDPIQATKFALKAIALRARALIEECRMLERQLDTLLQQVAPTTASVFARTRNCRHSPDRDRRQSRTPAIRGRLCAAVWSRSDPRRQADERTGTGCTAAATGEPTPLYTWPPSSGSDTANVPRPTPNAASPKE